MSNASTWDDENTRYLSAAVARIRMLLEVRGATPPPPATAADPARPWLQRLRRNAQGGPTSEPQVLRLGSAVGDDAATDTSSSDAKPEESAPPALLSLTRRLGLTRFEQDVLLLCVAAELDSSVAALCARAQGDTARPHPTFALALSLFPDPAWDALSPERPLRHWRLIEINQPGGQSLTGSALRN